jgi:thiol-disulfide isomerase/thioredoxin
MKGGKMKIIKVTDNNINEVNNLITKKNQKVVAKFTADWCGHCKDLNSRVMPGVEEIIKTQSGPGILLNVSDLMMPKLQGIDTRINGFPSIRSFVGGKKKKDYNG